MEQEKKTCDGCKYFIQHYRKDRGQNYSEVDCGHCTHPMVKARKPETPACKRFNKKR